MGVNYYPRHSTEVFEAGVHHGGGFADPRPDQDAGVDGLREVLRRTPSATAHRSCSRRRASPVSVEDAHRVAGRRRSRAVEELRARGHRRRRLHVVAPVRHVRVDVPAQHGAPRRSTCSRWACSISSKDAPRSTVAATRSPTVRDACAPAGAVTAGGAIAADGCSGWARLLTTAALPVAVAKGPP